MARQWPRNLGSAYRLASAHGPCKPAVRARRERYKTSLPAKSRTRSSRTVRGRDRITGNRSVRSRPLAPLRHLPADRDCQRCPEGSHSRHVDVFATLVWFREQTALGIRLRPALPLDRLKTGGRLQIEEGRAPPGECGPAMREVEVRLKRQKLADVLGEMRQWLDQHDCVPVSFDIARGRRGALLANVLFKEDHNAEAFLRDFG